MRYRSTPTRCHNSSYIEEVCLERTQRVGTKQSSCQLVAHTSAPLALSQAGSELASERRKWVTSAA